MAHNEDIFDFVGQTLHDKYRIDAVVGEGGFGVVYKGFHLSFELPIAVKCLKVPGHFTPDARQLFLDRFREEGKHLATLSQHGSITRVYDFAVAASAGQQAVPYLVLEWLEGQDLEHILAARRAAGRPFSEHEAIQLVRPAIDALAFAHQHGIAHRDIKPANLFITKTARGEVIKVLDFGIAKVMQEGESATERQTRTTSGFRAFSPGYGAPEQFNASGFGGTGPWTDVHAIGLILSEMVSGRRPLDTSSAAELVMQATGAHRPTPSSHGAHVSDGFERVCAQALALRPADRYPDAQALLDAIDALHVPAPAVDLDAPMHPSPAAAALPMIPAPEPMHPLPPPPPQMQMPPPAYGHAPPAWGPPPIPAQLVAPSSSASGRTIALVAVSALVGVLVVGGAAGFLLFRSRAPAPPPHRPPPTVTPDTRAEPCVTGREQPCRRACDRGDQASCVRLGWMYVEGNGVPKNHARAAELFVTSCNKGNALGCNNLGWLYYNGWGVQQNRAQAVVFYRKACDGGEALGCTNLAQAYQKGEGVPRNIDETVRIYQDACNRNIRDACNNLGILYDKGEGVPQNDGVAVTYYDRACDMQLAIACSNLGYMYDMGHGVPQDQARAVRLYQTACTGNSGLGCHNLGSAYERGIGGLHTDLNEARRYYAKACGLGEQDACDSAAKLAH